MVVRVRIRIVNRGTGKDRVLRVLVNGGAESYEPVIVVDKSIAEELGLSLEVMDIVEVELASTVTHNYISREKYLVELLDDKGRVLSSVYAYIAVDPHLIEPLITDATIDELGIVVVSFKKGLWRHSSDPPSTVRESA